MEKVSKKKRKAEKTFSLFLCAFCLSFSLFFTTMLDVVYNYFPGCQRQTEMIFAAVTTFVASALFGFVTAKSLSRYNQAVSAFYSYQKARSNKFQHEMEEEQND